MKGNRKSEGITVLHSELQQASNGSPSVTFPLIVRSGPWPIHSGRNPNFIFLRNYEAHSMSQPCPVVLWFVLAPPFTLQPLRCMLHYTARLTNQSVKRLLFCSHSANSMSVFGLWWQHSGRHTASPRMKRPVPVPVPEIKSSNANHKS